MTAKIGCMKLKAVTVTSANSLRAAKLQNIAATPSIERPI